MQNKVVVLALLLGFAGVAVGGYALSRDPAESFEVEERLRDVEDQLARLERKLDAQRGSGAEEPSLFGRGPEVSLSIPVPSGATAPAPTPDPETGSPVARGSDDPQETAEKIEDLVNEAVEKKARQLRQMKNKKPSLDVFASVIGLSDVQREALAQEVVRGQSEIESILRTPAEDGTDFIEELVEVWANGIANPGKNAGRGKQLYQRLLSERIPGTDETYFARVETVKQSMRDTFRRDWNKKQYAHFESWQMDPTEIKDVEDSPYKQLELRVRERARALGAKFPEDAAK